MRVLNKCFKAVCGHDGLLVCVCASRFKTNVDSNVCNRREQPDVIIVDISMAAAKNKTMPIKF